MREKIYIINAKRLPACKSKGEKIPPEKGGDGIKKYPGKYAALDSVELLSVIFRDLLKTAQIEIKDIADVLTGCAIQEAEQGANICRLVLLTLDIPQEIPGATINRLCGSSLSSCMKGTEFLIAGQFFEGNKPELVMIGGVEHMGHHDMEELLQPSKFLYDKFGKSNIKSFSMGLTAEQLATIYNISRKDQEIFAYKSHLKAITAIDEGKFKDEIVAIKLPDGTLLSEDVSPRRYASQEDALKQFSKLRAAFKGGGTVTAATAAPYTDGAAGLMIATESYIKRKGIKPLAEIISWASSGVDPNIMGIGPIAATQKALIRAGIDFKQIGLIELNEAFCAQSLACIKQFSKDYNIPEEDIEKITNVNGGATALGHPLGATGAKLLTTIVHEMKRRADVEYSLVTMCIGLGQGDAMILKKVDSV